MAQTSEMAQASETSQASEMAQTSGAAQTGGSDQTNDAAKTGEKRGKCGEWNDLAAKMERCGRQITQCLEKRRGQSLLLRALYQRGEMPQKELQEQLGIQPGSMSEIAAKLESGGFLVRVRSAEDRRKVSLSITEKGRARVDQRNEARILQRRAQLFSALTPEEQQTLEQLLDKFSADWERRAQQSNKTEPDKTDETGPETE